MNVPIRPRIEAMTQLSLILRQHQEMAEAMMAELDQCLEQLASTGLLHSSVFLGSTLLSRPYADGSGRTDSDQTVQAALLHPGGVGVILWDTDDYLNIKEGPEAHARLHFVPFADSEPALKALLLPHLQPLLARLCERIINIGFHGNK